jgi:chromosomal replication initiation ATPase DnaA
MARLSQISKLPEAFLSKTLDNIAPNEHNAEMLEAARAMMAEPFGWLYIWGGEGSAKTDVLIALVNHFNQNGRTAIYTKFTKIVDYMRDAYSEKKKRALDPFADEGYVERFKRLVQIPVLAIDEMDKVFRETDLAQEFRFDFLDDRYMQALAGETITIFVGNRDPATFPSVLWDRFRDGRFRVVRNEQPSARPKMRR